MNQAPKSNNLGVLGKVSVNFRRVKKTATLLTTEEKTMKNDVRPMINNSADGFADRYPKA